ncbi:hypothetical protein Ddc_06993 [Ditylenchus destructor]|nr:hypothetical protein Ddc_06993 [Ditylenchus destructor]
MLPSCSFIETSAEHNSPEIRQRNFRNPRIRASFLRVGHKNRSRILLKFACYVLVLTSLWHPVYTQLAICPVGFVFGGLCGLSGGAFLGGACPLSLPPFHCIRGSCCRDVRPLFQRLGPTFYPPGLGLGLGGIGLGGICFDRALNCYLYTTYCILPIYALCMATHCARTCGLCFSGIGGGIGGFPGGIGGGIGGFGGGLGGFGGGLGGGFGGGLGGFGGFPGGFGG